MRVCLLVAGEYEENYKLTTPLSVARQIRISLRSPRSSQAANARNG
jgi:hypothetical protein